MQTFELTYQTNIILSIENEILKIIKSISLYKNLLSKIAFCETLHQYSNSYAEEKFSDSSYYGTMNMNDYLDFFG